MKELSFITVGSKDTKFKLTKKNFSEKKTWPEYKELIRVEQKKESFPGKKNSVSEGHGLVEQTITKSRTQECWVTGTESEGTVRVWLK